MNTLAVLLILAGAWVLQSLLAMRQMMAFRRRLAGLLHAPGAGYAGIGVAAGKMLPGVMVVLTTDPAGIVIRSERMKGLSVFAGLREFPELIGADVQSLASLGTSTRYKGRLRTAIEKAAKQVLERMAKDQVLTPETRNSGGGAMDLAVEEGGDNALLGSCVVIS